MPVHVTPRRPFPRAFPGSAELGLACYWKLLLARLWPLGQGNFLLRAIMHRVCALVGHTRPTTLGRKRSNVLPDCYFDAP